jgi:hypothetical protein
MTSGHAGQAWKLCDDHLYDLFRAIAAADKNHISLLQEEITKMRILYSPQDSREVSDSEEDSDDD